MTTSNRMLFLDNLRGFVVLLVIVLHGSMSYMALVLKKAPLLRKVF